MKAKHLNQDLKTRTSESNIYELIDLLWRRRLLITACLLGVVLPIVLANFTMPPVYEAQTTIIFEQSREPLPSFDISEAFSRKSYIVNQIEEIKKYDELLNNKALSMIQIDLDDGVLQGYPQVLGIVNVNPAAVHGG
jgi:capsular polysaccharide biosynthesis protein